MPRTPRDQWLPELRRILDQTDQKSGPQLPELPPDTAKLNPRDAPFLGRG